MSNYKSRFDEKLPLITNAIDELPARIDEMIPGLTRPGLKRFFKRFSSLLGRLDKSGAKHPALLAYAGANVAEHVIATADTVIESIRSGPEAFFRDQMPQLADEQFRLERAIGVPTDELRALSISAAADLAASVTRAEEMLERLHTLAATASSTNMATEADASSIRKAVASTEADLREIEAFKVRLERLTSPDGRRKDSIEFLAKKVREQASEIDTVFENAKKATASIENLNQKGASNINIIETSKKRIDQIKIDAEKILNLSTQAGLAASYLTESENLKFRANIFTGILYAVSAITIGVAAFYVLPSLETAINNGKNHSISDAVPITILRATILAPLVYVIYFTTKQISSIETLRMDYAEKAAASLAYSGYKDEMSSDNSLLERLKGSLLLKFAEHPERLLRKRPVQDRIEVEAPGFKASSTSAELSSPTSNLEKIE